MFKWNSIKAPIIIRNGAGRKRNFLEATMQQYLRRFFDRLIGFRVTGGWFRGEAARGVPNGRGVIRYSNGAVYEGLFLDGLKHGFGEIIHTNKFSYSGNWYRGRAAGYGKVFYKNGNSYIGHVDGFLRSGAGDLYLKNANVNISAKWKNDAPESDIKARGGSFSFTGRLLGSINHNRHSFPFNGSEQDVIDFLKINAFGEIEFSDGRKISGIWKETGTADNVTVVDPDGIVWRGNIRNHKLDGFVCATMPNGVVYNCFWEGGVQVRAFGGIVNDRRPKLTMN